jgi:predicted 2-oxoglutarate/Fe(II)-dependent dioxygenase YbiX
MQATPVDPALKTVTFDVGGVCYPLLVSDIEKFPGSFFETAIKKEWLLEESVIKVERDGLLFRYVHAFLVSEALPRKKGRLILDADVIEALKAEADFFNLPTLEAECNDLDRREGPEVDLQTYRNIQEYVERLANSWGSSEFECEFPAEDHQPTDLVFLLGKISSPFCVQGEFKFGYYITKDDVLFKTSTLSALNIPELLAECEESGFGRGTEAVMDPSVRKSHEIPASKLNAKTMESLAGNLKHSISSLARNLDLELRPYKLVIYQDGGHFDAHRDTVRGDGHIGTLVLILNSEYTGGELEITHNGQTEVVTDPYSWVAMYGDCLHKINPVTSGTRVSLIFDIYAKRVCINERDFWHGGCDPEAEFGITDSNRVAILEGIEAVFTNNYGTLIICLAHMYPLNQAAPEFLKGGDRALYELLQDAYDLEVVVCQVNNQYYDDHDWPVEAAAGPFTSFNPDCDSPPDTPRAKVARTQRTKFLIPAPINAAGVLEYCPYDHHCGNEPSPAKSLYLVSGLQVRKRA